MAGIIQMVPLILRYVRRTIGGRRFQLPLQQAGQPVMDLQHRVKFRRDQALLVPRQVAGHALHDGGARFRCLRLCTFRAACTKHRTLRTPP